MCKKLLFALLSLWSVSVLAADPWCRPHGGRGLSFKWEPKNSAEPNLGSVRITRTSTGKTMQVLAKLENYHGDDSSLRIMDLNNDGCADLAVVSSVAAIGNESDTVFLYNPKTTRFVLNKVLSDIGGLEIDGRDKNCVGGSWKGGADSYYSSRYCWRNEKLVMESESSVSPLINADGNLQCYEHVETHYRSGKKKVKKSCTQEL